MSTSAEQVPDWTLGWRLQRALDWAGMSVQEMADELDVSRGTISRWCNDHGTPRSIYLRAWAARCRVPMVWLQYGDEGPRLVSTDALPSGRASESISTAELKAIRRRIPLRAPRIEPLLRLAAA